MKAKSGKSDREKQYRKSPKYKEYMKKYMKKYMPKYLPEYRKRFINRQTLLKRLEGLPNPLTMTEVDTGNVTRYVLLDDVRILIKKGNV